MIGRVSACCTGIELKGSAIRQLKYAGSATARIALFDSRSETRPHEYMVSALAIWLVTQSVVTVPRAYPICRIRYTVINGAAMLEATFQDPMKTITRRKFTSRNGARTIATTGTGAVAIAGSGTLERHYVLMI